MISGCVTVHDSMSQNESKWHLMGMESDEAEGSLQILGSNRWPSSACIAGDVQQPCPHQIVYSS